MAKTMTAAAPTTRRLKFLQSCAEGAYAYIAGQVAHDVPALIAVAFLRDRQAIETADPERRPKWATCCGTSWIPQRVLAVDTPDERVVQRWSDEDPTLPPAYTQCPVCRRGWLL